MADDNGTTNPVADLLLELLTHFAKKNWVNENEDPIKLILTLENGLTFRGHVVPRDTWLQANLLPDGDNAAGNGAAPGSWPRDTITNVTRADPNHDMVYLTNVEFLSGDKWVPGCNMACDRKKVHGKGDQYLSEHSA